MAICYMPLAVSSLSFANGYMLYAVGCWQLAVGRLPLAVCRKVLSLLKFLGNMNQTLKRRLPAEWENQSFVQLTWPHEDTDWREMLDEAVACFVEIAKTVVRYEKLLIVCKDVNQVLKQLGDDIDYKRINLIELPSNDTWARDHGAITVIEYSNSRGKVSGEKTILENFETKVDPKKGVTTSTPSGIQTKNEEGNTNFADFETEATEYDETSIWEQADTKGLKKVLDFSFNGWGMKFASNYDNLISCGLFSPSLSSFGHPAAIALGKTNVLAEEMNAFWGEYRYEDCRDFILEGGSIESDGNGTLLTTAECLLSLNRNHLPKQEIEIRLKRIFGADQVLWLNHGYLAGDDTDSHVDTLARLCPNDTICYVKCSDENDEHYQSLKSMEEELKSFKNLEGEAYKLIDLPMPDAIFDGEQRLPATYANFLIINDAVLVPTYGCIQDHLALAQIKKAFPNREIIGIDCNALIKQHGSLHCVTMQFPA